MGLDMYLLKTKRYKDVSMREIDNIDCYLRYCVDKNAKNSTFKEWCGIDETELNQDALKHFKETSLIVYQPWDEKHQFPETDIITEVGYWRKANQIHGWFVEKVQDGIDDCEYHHEVTKDILEELRDTCMAVLKTATNTEGCTECHDIGFDVNLAESVLPTQAGFFFGTYEYDDYYLKDLRDTYDICNKVLDETDFDKEMIYYVSSW